MTKVYTVIATDATKPTAVTTATATVAKDENVDIHHREDATAVTTMTTMTAMEHISTRVQCRLWI